jgi:hypothetical protein
LNSCQAQTEIVVPDFTECALNSAVIVVCPNITSGGSGVSVPRRRTTWCESFSTPSRCAYVTVPNFISARVKR